MMKMGEMLRFSLYHMAKWRLERGRGNENDHKIKAAAMMDKPLNGSGGEEKGILFGNKSKSKKAFPWFLLWIYLNYGYKKAAFSAPSVCVFSRGERLAGTHPSA